jgi:amidophosphoribosyltransferase
MGELAASGMSVDEIRKSIDADSLVYLEIDDLRQVLGRSVNGFCYSCFNGAYPVDVSHCGSKEDLG